MGIKSCVDMVVNVPADISVEQADQVALRVKSTVEEALGRSAETQVRFKADETRDSMEPIRGAVGSYA